MLAGQNCTPAVDVQMIGPMSVGRLVPAVGATGCIVVAVRFEEHDLRRDLGDPYQRYIELVPRFLPPSPTRTPD